MAVINTQRNQNQLEQLAKEEPNTKEPEPEKNSQQSQFIKN